MRSGKGELSQIVVKSRRLPGGGGMALSTIVAEIVLDMVGVSHAIKIAFMAGKTLSWRILISGAMALHTWNANMCSSQRK
jgi:hypothetical protein